MAGTYAACSRDSHFLAYKGNHPTMVRPTLFNPNLYYARKPNPRFKTNCNNRSTFTLGDDREWDFDTIHQTHYRVPTKIPPRHESIMPGGMSSQLMDKKDLDKAYVQALNKTGIAGVRRLELAIRQKIEQRTAGGGMVLRKAFKYFDADASGDIDPDEFYSAMHAFGLEFTEDQVLALFGFYDTDRDGGLSYYEFIDKVLESDWGEGERESVVLAVQLDDEEVEMKSVLRPEELDEVRCQKLFRHFDVNGSGEIDMRELGLLIKQLGMRMEQEAINNAMIDLDKDNNGAISFAEFWSWFQQVATGGKTGPAGGSSTLKHKMQDVMCAASMNEGTSGGGRSSSAIKPPQRPNSAFGGSVPQKQAPEINSPIERKVASASEQQKKIARADSAEADAEVSQITRNDLPPGRTKQGTWMSRAAADRPRTAGSWRRCSQPGGRARPQSAAVGRDGSCKPAAWGSEGWRSVSRSDFRPPSAHGRALPPRLKIGNEERKARPMSAHPVTRFKPEVVSYAKSAPASDPNCGTVREPRGSPSGFRL